MKKLIDLKSIKGYSPLHYATLWDNFKAVEIFINNGAKLDLKENKYGDTPLHAAGWFGYEKLYNLLI